MNIPRCTYRLQFTPAFGFRSALAIVPYLAALGVSHIYASPIFKCKKGSTHGYDIVDHSRLNPELGSEEDFEALISAVKNAGMGWLQDFVPNHMGYDSDNAMLMDVFESGKASRYFQYFDVDWDHPYEYMRGRILAPFLGKFYAECLESGEITLIFDEQGFAVRYYEIRFPLKIESYNDILQRGLPEFEKELGPDDPQYHAFARVLDGLSAVLSPKEIDRNDKVKRFKALLMETYNTNDRVRRFIDANLVYFNGNGDPASFNELDKLLSQQYFRLSFWKVASEEINYRRFFTINELISLSIEEDAVFNDVHRLIFKYIEEGKIDGLRIDHIDGLYDPSGYLARLRESAQDLYIVIEKILAPGEALPRAWPVQGTTGYDFLSIVNGVFCKKENERYFTRIYYNFTKLNMQYHDLMLEKKRLIISKYMAGNIENLAQALKNISSNDRHGRDFTLYGLRRTLVELLATFPVYRTYIVYREHSETDIKYIQEALNLANIKRPGLNYELSFIEKFLTLKFFEGITEEQKSKWLRFIMNFQQYTSPVMAKGFEDTVFYVYNRLLSLNEVGCSPNRFGLSISQFHEFNGARAETFPGALNATSTHDTKRGEDARARLNVLSELPAEFEAHARLWKRLNRTKKTKHENNIYPEANDELLIYQSLIGAFPFSSEPDFTDRMKKYIVKAVREAKAHTAWIKPDTAYEQACERFIEQLLEPQDGNEFIKDFTSFQRTISWYGLLNSLSQTLIKITAPGVPDIYQGSELWDLKLVDPDNRGPVDFAVRAKMLRNIRERAGGDLPALIGALFAAKEDGCIKLFLIYQVLQARKRSIDLFARGRYLPLETGGRYGANITAYARVYEHAWAVVIAPRFFAAVAAENRVPLNVEIWQDTFIRLPAEAPPGYVDAISGTNVIARGSVLGVGEALALFPAALLMGQAR